ncbi:MAG TPA: 2-oxoglutarate and iron-dependent oxygenase domain-containing protein [Gammaproteobacteria bacterium]|nr:2-oxoglutarate and iron-dependent oxygenase domain-containing protein [Gammaproteobacteria bacterium]
MQSLPELDISGFLAAPRSAAGAAFVGELRAACHGPGFCYIAGHDVPAAADAAVMQAARNFFALPENERRELAIASSPHFRGYTLLGAEITKKARDWREVFDAGPEEPAVSVAPGDPVWLRLRGPNQWPATLPGMRRAVLDWMRAMDGLGLAVLRALALGLGQSLEHFDSAVLPRGDPHLKLSRYPPQHTHADTGQGVGMHHDSGLVSFVLQDDVGGLQVEVGDTLIDATPKAGTYVMNLGEMLQAATSGYLRATKHRVRSPLGLEPRLSVAYFFHPRLDCVFDPVALPPELSAAASGGNNADPHDPVLRVFGENYLKIRLRSHPDVAAAHYRDVLRPIEPARSAAVDG